MRLKILTILLILSSANSFAAENQLGKVRQMIGPEESKSGVIAHLMSYQLDGSVTGFDQASVLGLVSTGYKVESISFENGYLSDGSIGCLAIVKYAPTDDVEERGSNSTFYVRPVAGKAAPVFEQGCRGTL